jgi:hypothetical protein
MRTTVFAVVLLLPETVRAIFDNMCASAHSTTVSNHLLDHVAILSSLTFHPPPEFILTTYQKRWPIEVFHKSLKQNAALGKAPVRRVVTQNNHVFAVLYAFFKLECLKIKRRLNHFALRSHLYLKAIRIAYEELQVLKAA